MIINIIILFIIIIIIIIYLESIRQLAKTIRRIDLFFKPIVKRFVHSFDVLEKMIVSKVVVLFNNYYLFIFNIQTKI